MRKLSTKEVIRALPIEQENKDKLISQFDSFDEDTKLEISEICWKAFHEMKHHIENYWRDRITFEIANKQRTTEVDLEKQLFEEVWKEIEQRISGKIEDDSKLASIRENLENLINTSNPT